MLHMCYLSFCGIVRSFVEVVLFGRFRIVTNWLPFLRNFRRGDSAAKVLPSRAPTDVLSSIVEIWYRPVGPPLQFKCDQDKTMELMVVKSLAGSTWHTV